MNEDGPRIDDGQQRLIRELYPGLRDFAGVVAPAEVDPEDLVQDALYRVLATRRLTELDHPKAFLRRTLLNLASNHRRRLGRRRRALLKMQTHDQAHDAYPSDVGELLELAPKARAVIYLRVIEGLSYRDVAATLGVKESSARSTATRALRRLRHDTIAEVPRGQS